MLIAASISRAGVCAELVEDVLTIHELLISDFILGEVTRKLMEKFKFPETHVRQLRRFLSKTATVVVPVDLPAGVCRDATDIPVLGTAVAGKAHILVTVDKDLLTIREYAGTIILKPSQFWAAAQAN